MLNYYRLNIDTFTKSPGSTHKSWAIVESVLRQLFEGTVLQMDVTLMGHTADMASHIS